MIGEAGKADIFRILLSLIFFGSLYTSYNFKSVTPSSCYGILFVTLTCKSPERNSVEL